LYQGNRLVVFPPFEPDAFLRYMSEYKITTICLIPYQGRQFLDFPKVKDYDLSHWRLMVMIGSHLSADLQKKTYV